ncbi:MAG TPA: hypothetical protein VLS51_11050 [Propionibacteriaceae bacterium]|nr:hypothetical protein [Propionibacteriaceae bacterium]
MTAINSLDELKVLEVNGVVVIDCDRDRWSWREVDGHWAWRHRTLDGRSSERLMVFAPLTVDYDPRGHVSITPAEMSLLITALEHRVIALRTYTLEDVQASQDLLDKLSATVAARERTS